MVDLPTKGIVHQLESQSERIPRPMKNVYFSKILGFTYLQYLQPNSSLQFARIVGIYVFTGYTSEKLEKNKKE